MPTAYERKMAGRKAARERKKKRVAENLSPYYTGDRKQLTWKQLPRHEIIYDKEGTPIPNPRSAPGLIPLLPTSLADLAIETAFLSVSEKNPTLAIALGLVPGMIPRLPYTIKQGDLAAGHAIGKRLYKKGIKAVKSDPMLSDIPFEETSEFLTKNPEYWGLFKPHTGKHLASLLRESRTSFADAAHLTRKMGPTFEFFSPSLSELLYSPYRRLWGHRNWAESTVRHEGRHFKQVQEFEDYHWWKKHGDKPVKVWDAFTGKPYISQNLVPAKIVKKKYLHEVTKPFGTRYNTLIDIPVPKNAKDTNWIDWGKHPKKDKAVHTTSDKGNSRIEVEARLEEISTMGPASSGKYLALRNAGYTSDEIRIMVNKYGKAREKVYGKMPGGRFISQKHWRLLMKK